MEVICLRVTWPMGRGVRAQLHPSSTSSTHWATGGGERQYEPRPEGEQPEAISGEW